MIEVSLSLSIVGHCRCTWHASKGHIEAHLVLLQVYVALNEALAFKTNLTSSLNAPASASWIELSDSFAGTHNRYGVASVTLQQPRQLNT